MGRVVILGAGHAGGSAAAYLRQYGHAGPIALVGDEPVLPYQRPPLSKAWLKGEAGEDDLQLRPPSFYAEQDIALRLGVRATRIDREARQVVLEGGDILPYDILILATGADQQPMTAPDTPRAYASARFTRSAAELFDGDATLH